MPIIFKCTGCKEKIRVRTKHQGKKVRCPQCQDVQRVPIAPPDKLSPQPAPEVSSIDLAPESLSQEVASFWDVSPQDPAPVESKSSSTYPTSNQIPGLSTARGISTKPSQDAKYLQYCATVLIVILWILFGLQGLGISLQLLAAIATFQFPIQSMTSLMIFVFTIAYMGLEFFTILNLMHAQKLCERSKAWLGFIMSLVTFTLLFLILPVLPFRVMGLWHLSKPDVQKSFRN